MRISNRVQLIPCVRPMVSNKSVKCSLVTDISKLLFFIEYWNSNCYPDSVKYAKCLLLKGVCKL